jgi:predicted dehydrogenase
MATVRWGILSTANIGVKKVIPAMQQAEHVEVTAIGSRDQARARMVADQLGIPVSYGSYEEVLADPKVDAVYIPLPNHLHVEWSIKALEAGKHVLCEKPIGLSVTEAEQLQAAARMYPSLKLMEAFMYRHHPQWVKTKELVDNGELGAVKAIQAVFSYNNRNPDDIRNQADLGGGGLMDIGCYPISVARFLFGTEPTAVAASLEYDPAFKTDRYGACVLKFAHGTAAFTYSTQLEPRQRVNVMGTDGRIEVMIPFNAPPDRPCIITVAHGGTEEEIALPTADQYTVQGELMSQAILEDTPVPMPIDDAVANMRVIERCFAAARSGTWT